MAAELRPRRIGGMGFMVPWQGRAHAVALVTEDHFAVAGVLLRPPARGEQVLAQAIVGKTVRVWPSIIRDYTREVYQQRSRWSSAIALGAAIAIHAIVIVIVGLDSERPIAAETLFSEQIVEVVLESGPPELIEPQQTDEEPLVADVPPPSAEQFVEEAPTPPPHRVRRSRSAAPLARPGAGGGPGGASMSSGSGGSMSSGKAVAINAPRPEYPEEARLNHTTGRGVVEMTVDTATGRVTNVEMVQSTGSAVLDNAVTSAFRRWRFRAGTATRVRTPITFTLTGVQY